MSNCKIKFILNSTDGASKEIELEVPEGLSNESNIDDIVKYLLGNKNEESIKKIIEEIQNFTKESSYAPQKFTISQIPYTQAEDKQKKITNSPLGQYNLSSLISESTRYNMGNFENKDRLDLLKKNILITTAQYFNPQVNIIKDVLGRTTIVLPNNQQVKDNYLCAVLVNNSIQNDDIAKNIIDQVISSLKDKQFKKISKENKYEDFILAYYLDRHFFNAVNKIAGKSISKLFDRSLGYHIQIDRHDTFGWVQDLIVKKNGSSYIKIKDFIEKFKEISPQIKLTKEEASQKILEILNIINNSQKGFYYDVEEIYSDKIYITDTKNYNPKLLEQEETIIGELINFQIPLEQHYKGYLIYKYANKYYISNKIIKNKEEIDSISNYYNSLSEAKSQITNKVRSQKVSVKNSKILSHISSESEKKLEDNKSAEDAKIYLNGTVLFNLDVELKQSKDIQTILNRAFGTNSIDLKYSDAIIKLKNNEIYQEIFDNILINDPTFNIEEKLNTAEKLFLFVVNTNDIIYEEDLQYKVEEVLKAISQIENAKPKFYIYSFEEVQKTETKKIKDKDKKEIEQKINVRYIKHKNIPYKFQMQQEVFIRKPKKFKTSLSEIIKQFKKIYPNSKIEIVTSQEIVVNDKFKNINNINHAKAFLLNGTLYVNVDKANYGDLAHEYLHLFLAHLKTTNLQEYVKLINIVEKLPDKDRIIKFYRDIKDNRSIPDLYEEILVTKLGEFITRSYGGKDFNVNENTLYEQISDAFSSIFGFTSNANILDLDTTLEDLLINFGSVFTSTENEIKDSFEQETIKSRQVTNVISNLIKNKEIEEQCE